MANTNTLYSTSPALKDIVSEVATKMASAIEQPVTLVQYITLPDIGQRIVLRFDLGNNLKVSFEEADRLESSLRLSAGSEYWVALTGSCYQHPLPDLRHQQIAIAHEISSKLLQYSPTRHSEHIRVDAQRVREWLNLSAEYLVWEVEVPMEVTTDETIIRVINTRKDGEGTSLLYKSEHVRIADVDCVVEYLQNDPSFVGWIKAYFMADRQYKALASYISQFNRTEQLASRL